MKFSVLASGSKANCTLITSGATAILVDCGLSAKETFLRLRSRGFDESCLTGILISHEHDDHVKGVRALANYTGVPVYFSEGTYSSSDILRGLPLNQVRFFDPFTKFRVGELEVLPLPVSHDATEPVCFRIDANSKSIAILSDLGVFGQAELDFVRGVDALLIEANHDLDKLWKTHYPWNVKERIAGNRGHLSNDCASRFIYNFEAQSVRNPRIVIATHISENSNTPDMAREAIRSGWRGIEMPEFVSAMQTEATELYKL